jgi:hypothetical protein
MQLEAAAGPIRSYNASAFLAPMLQSKEPVVSEDSRVRMPEDGEKAAFVHWIGRLGQRKKFFLRHGISKRYSFREELHLAAQPPGRRWFHSAKKLPSV